MNERNRKQMKATEYALRDEVERLKASLVSEQNSRKQVIQQQTEELVTENARLLQENEGMNLQNSKLVVETKNLKNEMISQKEEHDRTVTKTKNQVFEHEKLLRAERCFTRMTPTKINNTEIMNEENTLEDVENDNENVSGEKQEKNFNNKTPQKVSLKKTNMKQTPRRVSKLGKSTPMRAAFGFGS